MKNMKNITIGMIIILFIIIVIIGSDFFLLWLPLEHSPEYPAKVAALFMAVTALVTLFLALATFNATEQSNLREQEHRRDEIKRENRDRKELLLNEIIDWALDVVKSAIEPDTPDLSNDKDAVKSWPFLDRQSKNLDTLPVVMAKGISIEQITQDIFQSLKEPTEKTRQNLRDQFSNLTGYKEWVEAYKSKKVEMDTEYLKKRAQEVKKVNIYLHDNGRKLIAEATKIKTKDIA